MQTYLQRLRAFGAKLIPCQGMTLRCKAIGTVVLPVILLAIAISLLITHIVSRGFESAEAVSAVQSASQVDGMMSEELERLRISATDWAQNEPALRLELGTCTTSGIQVLVVYDRDGLPQMQTSCVDASGRSADSIRVASGTRRFQCPARVPSSRHIGNLEHHDGRVVDRDESRDRSRGLTR